MKRIFNIKLSRLSVILIILPTMLLSVSCRKWVSVDAPPTSLTNQNVYSTDFTATAVLTGIYGKMASDRLTTGFISLSYYAGLSADEFTLFTGQNNTTVAAYYTNKLSNSNTLASDYWTTIYPYVFKTNAAIEGLNTSTTITTPVKQQLLGEAKFMRAFCYFYLVNLYGDVPLLTGTNYQANQNATRTATNLVWQQIVSDLLDAQNLLSKNFLDATVLTSSTERVRPSYWAATALLARTYLYLGRWADAETQASQLINNTALFSLSTPNNTFLKASLGNKEAIWQLQPVITGYNTQDAVLFVIPSTGLSNNNPISLSTSLINSFETGDLRKTSWVGNVTVAGTTYSFPNKYKVYTVNNAVTGPAAMTEFESVFRLGEQFLIRAEARAQQSKLIGAGSAAEDLNTIRARAGLSATTAITQPQLLTAIQNERRVELFSEWGHRWLDIKRTSTIDQVMQVAAPGKNTTWQSYQQLYPIPLGELQKAPGLVQNPQY